MRIVESILDIFRRLSDEDQRQLMREMTRARLADAARRVELGGAATSPISDEELSRLVHEARREVLRARGV